MTVDPDKLRELADTLTDDQRKLLHEGLAGGRDLDPDSLTEVFSSYDNQAIFRELAATPASDAGAADGGVGDGGVPEAGTTAPPTTTEPPLTRW